MQKIFIEELAPNFISEIFVGLGKASELLAAKDNNYLLFSLGSSLKNFGAANYHHLISSTSDKYSSFATASIGGAFLRSTATFLDDLFIHYNLFEQHHLTKVSDAIYTGFLLANADNILTINSKITGCVNFTGTILWTGGLLLTSYLMGAADTINFERNIAKEAYNSAAKIDKLTQNSSHLVSDLYASIALSSVNQTIRQSLSDHGFDFGNPISLTLNAATSFAIGNDSAENFKKYFADAVLDNGPLGNQIKFQNFLKQHPKKLDKLIDQINSTKHLISFLPLKYQTTTLGDHIAASNKYGLLYKSLNNLFNFYKQDDFKDVIHKHQDKEHKNDAFIKALNQQDYQEVKSKIEQKLKPSEINPFWDFTHKMITHLLPITTQLTIAAYISHNDYGKPGELFFDSNNKFFGGKHTGNQLLVNSNLVKNLFDEFSGNPAHLDEIIDLMSTYNLNF